MTGTPRCSCFQRFQVSLPLVSHSALLIVCCYTAGLTDLLVVSTPISSTHLDVHLPFPLAYLYWFTAPSRSSAPDTIPPSLLVSSTHTLTQLVLPCCAEYDRSLLPALITVAPNLTFFSFTRITTRPGSLPALQLMKRLQHLYFAGPPKGLSEVLEALPEETKLSTLRVHDIPTMFSSRLQTQRVPRYKPVIACLAHVALALLQELELVFEEEHQKAGWYKPMKTECKRRKIIIRQVLY